MAASCACLNFSASDPNVQVYGLGVAAMRYQQRGFAVLPLERGGKKPHRMLPWAPDVSGGVHHATLDVRSAIDRWSLDPAANVGVATGQLSRLAVVDCDVKRGQNGPAVFWDFWARYPQALPTADIAVVTTPSGGCHLWFRTPAGVRVPERPGILPGVDIKGDGGLVVAPPSMILRLAMDRPGERGDGEVPVPYYWAAGCPCKVPDAPPWLLPWLESAPSSGSPGNTPGAGETAQPPDLDSLKRTGIPRGQRNAELYRLACQLFRIRGTNTEASLSVKEELMAVWSAGDRSGFSPRELLTIIDSARRFVQSDMDQSRGAIEGLTGWARKIEGNRS